MSRVARSGGSVHVVYMTCGDAYRLAAERSGRRVSLTPADFIAFGRLRQRESLAALVQSAPGDLSPDARKLADTRE